jgi:uncharacterized protein YycO
MDSLKLVFIKRPLNPVSALIRWALPRSRFAWALSSHVMIIDGDYVIEATMLHGVRRVLLTVAMLGVTVVAERNFSVPNAADGLTWARARVGSAYDFKGAFGLALTPDRDWHDPVSWFCYELAAGAIVNAGRDAFTEKGHITESTLLSIKP